MLFLSAVPLLVLFWIRNRLELITVNVRVLDLCLYDLTLEPSCSGHGSFSNNKALNDFIGHLTHASILVPFHGW